jgi:hypothetical protein
VSSEGGWAGGTSDKAIKDGAHDTITLPCGPVEGIDASDGASPPPGRHEGLGGGRIEEHRHEVLPADLRLDVIEEALNGAGLVADRKLDIGLLAPSGLSGGIMDLQGDPEAGAVVPGWRGARR